MGVDEIQGSLISKRTKSMDSAYAPMDRGEPGYLQGKNIT